MDNPNFNLNLKLLKTRTMADKVLQKWFPSTTAPFICNAPMIGYANAKVALAVHRAGGFGISLFMNLPSHAPFNTS